MLAQLLVPRRYVSGDRPPKEAQILSLVEARLLDSEELLLEPKQNHSRFSLDPQLIEKFHRISFQNLFSLPKESLVIKSVAVVADQQ